MAVTLRFQSSGAVPGDGHPIVMRGPSLTIGRGPENDVVLPDPDRMISKTHCALENHNGSVVVVDFSTNGTFLNYGKVALGRTATPINDGDVLIMGAYELVVQITSAANFAEPLAPLADERASFGNARAAPDPYKLLDDAAPGGDFLDSLLGGGKLTGPGQFRKQQEDFVELLPPLGDDGPLLGPAPDMPSQPAMRNHSAAITDSFIPAQKVASKSVIPDDWDDLLAPTPPSRPTAQKPMAPGADIYNHAPPPSRPSAIPDDDIFGGPAAAPPKPPVMPPPAPDAARSAARGPAAIPEDDFLGLSAPPPAAAPGPAPVAPPPAPALVAPPAAPELLAPAPPAARGADLAPPPPPLTPISPVTPFTANDAAAPPPADGPPPFAKPVRKPVDPVAPASFDPFVTSATPYDPFAKDASRPSRAGSQPAQSAMVPPPSVATVLEAPASVAALQPAASKAATGPVGGVDAARAFLAAVGAEDVKISDAELPDTMARLGRTLKSMIIGMREILMTRTSIKSEFRIEQTMVNVGGNNPLKFSVTPEQAIEAMVKPTARGYLTAEVAAAQALEDIRAHEIAMMTGMEAALKGVLGKLNPEALTAKIEAKGGFGGFLKNRKAQYWETYEAMYAEISDQAENDFHELFAKEFSQAYRAQLARLKEAKSKG